MYIPVAIFQVFYYKQCLSCFIKYIQKKDMEFSISFFYFRNNSPLTKNTMTTMSVLYLQAETGSFRYDLL